MHVVFVTKYRPGDLHDQTLNRCQTAMRKVCNDFKAPN
jgi:REP element-mobilizing transposase RayT